MNTTDKVRIALLDADVPDQCRYLLAVSGGVDSMVLLDIFLVLKRNVSVAHVNYKTRDADSEKDQQLVHSYCQKAGIPCYIHISDAAAAEGNFQKWARDERYRFFNQLLDDGAANLLVTAHHKDDQLETILMKILKGVPPQYLKGMPGRTERILRPLLDVDKLKLYEYAQKHKVPFNEDYTNAQNTYTRNVIRNELIPQFDELIPGWRENVLKLQGFSEHFKMLTTRISEGNLTGNKVDREWFLGQSEIFQSEIINMVLREFYHQQGEYISGSSFSELGNLPSLQTGKSIQIGNDVEVFRSRDEFIIRKNNALQKVVDVLIDEKDLPGTVEHVRISESVFENPKSGKLQISKKSLVFPLRLRSWIDGDRIKPLGMKGTQLISDVLTNKKIASEKKNEVILLQSFDEKICAVIFPKSENHDFPGLISEHVACNPGEQCIELQNIS